MHSSLHTVYMVLCIHKLYTVYVVYMQQAVSDLELCLLMFNQVLCMLDFTSHDCSCCLSAIPHSSAHTTACQNPDEQYAIVSRLRACKGNINLLAISSGGMPLFASKVS